MIDSLKALIFTLLGAAATALFPTIISKTSSGNSELNATFEQAVIPNPIPYLGDDLGKQLVEDIKRRFSIEVTLRDVAFIERSSNFTITNVEIWNKTKNRISNIDLTFNNVNYAHIRAPSTQEISSRHIRRTEKQQINIKHIDPNSFTTVLIIEEGETKYKYLKPVSIIADGKLVDLKREFKDESAFGFGMLLHSYPSIEILFLLGLFGFLFFIIVIPIQIYSINAIKKDPSKYKLIYTNSDIERARKVIKFIDQVTEQNQNLLPKESGRKKSNSSKDIV